jgi:hypothetical protein
VAIKGVDPSIGDCRCDSCEEAPRGLKEEARGCKAPHRASNDIGQHSNDKDARTL